MTVFNIVMVNYNTSEETIKAIESISNNIIKDYNVRIIIVDNNSTSYNKLKLNDIIKKDYVQLIELDENIGYFPALNVGLKCFDNTTFDNVYTIVCNNDLLFNDAFFNDISKRKWKEDIHALAPSVKTINNIYQNPSLIYKPSYIRYLMYSLYYSNYFLGTLILKIWRGLGLGIDSNDIKDTEEKEIFIGIGAIYILTASFFKNNSELSYPLFLYGEEAFFSKQIHDKNGRILYVPTVEVVHLESVSTKKIPSKFNYELNRKAFKLYKDYFKG
ncbi:hypothetical protein C5F63_17810 [Photobacterium damselae subsp. damselae]|uniref:glycosyltransferase family 2 protein n=1 Tax=Photobacterium damselae TaxID=38293 RepID=UPI000D077698|nr:glycosyltransferase [Photobacterium damselae]PSB83912.1 hypothetical protein C5F63_17810 [Photobacterium damselae subsp. damselae]